MDFLEKMVTEKTFKIQEFRSRSWKFGGEISKIGTIGGHLLSKYVMCVGECWVDKKVTDPPFTVLKSKTEMRNNVL